MSKIRQWLVIVLASGVIALGATYLFESQNAPSTGEALEGEDLLVSQQETPAAGPTDEQSFANAVLIDSDVNKPIQNSALSEAEQNVIFQWQLSLGRSIEQDNIYKSYDKDTLLKLASQGDIYALQLGSWKMREEDRTDVAHQMLTEAAARGSAHALMMSGIALEAMVKQAADGIYKDSEIRRDYKLKDGIPIRNALYRSATAHYLVAGMRGDRNTAEVTLKYVQNNWFGRPFTNREWQVAISDAEALYKHLSKIREGLGLDEFDNSYPIEYAKARGYPQENNFLEELKAKYK